MFYFDWQVEKYVISLKQYHISLCFLMKMVCKMCMLNSLNVGSTINSTKSTKDQKLFAFQTLIIMNKISNFFGKSFIYSVLKIQTIGNTYMVVTGHFLPPDLLTSCHMTFSLPVTWPSHFLSPDLLTSCHMTFSLPVTWPSHFLSHDLHFLFTGGDNRGRVHGGGRCSRCDPRSRTTCR